MPNTVNYSLAYRNMLDRIYKQDATTSILEAAESQYKFAPESAKTIYLKKISTQALGDYSRSGGYVAGTATIEWEAHTFGMDRGRSYNLDVMDAQEAMTSAMELMAENMRTNIVPEIDAYRYEKICTLASSIDEQELLTYDTVVDAIDTGVQTLDDAEVTKDGRVLFVSNTTYKNLKQAGDFINVRFGQTNNTKLDRTIETFDNMPLIKVPKARFYNDFDFLDGTSGGETAGGFTPASGAVELNFIIVPMSIVIAVIRHMPEKIIPPALNQTADAWFFAYRLYHDLFVPDNKVDGIYIHSKPAA